MLALVQQPLVHGQLHILDLCSFPYFKTECSHLQHWFKRVDIYIYIYKRYNVVKPTIDPF